MKELNNQDKVNFAVAVLRFRLGIIILVLVIILVINFLSPENFFSWKDNFVSKNINTDLTQQEYVYQPILFDTIDIKDGIHVPTGMVADTGVAEVIQNCGACHSLDLVKQNKATKEGWKEKIVWMQQTQKLWDLGAQEEIILKYLAKNYGPENSGRRKNLENIEWYKL